MNRQKVRICSYRRRGGGLRKIMLWSVWSQMRQRCNNPNNGAYHRYGGRGISVCNAWDSDFLSFRGWALSNGYRKGLTVDRIDNDGNYRPGNCRFATMKEQANNRSVNPLYVLLSYCGKTQTIAAWSRELGLNKKTIPRRIRLGWPDNRVFSCGR